MPGTKKSKEIVNSKTLQFSVDALEARRLLTSFVDVQVIAGDLVITGDAENSMVQIDQTGLASNQFRVTPLLNTEIVDEGAVPVIYSGVTRDIRVNLQEGNDGLLISDAKFRDLRFNDVAGQSAITVNNHTVLRNAFITNGAGTDFTHFHDVTLANQLKINNGDGNSTTIIGQHAEIHGNVSIVNQAGFDHITLDKSDFHKNVTIRNSDGGSLVETINAEIDGNLRITNAAGNDSLYMTYGHIARSVFVSNADGGTDFDMTGTRIWKNLTVRATEGTTAVSIAHPNSGVTQVSGNMLFSLGTGLWTSFQLENFHVGKNVTLRTGAPSSVDLDWTIISGRTKIVTGGGNDIIKVEDGVYAGKFDLRTGAGNDHVHLDNAGETNWDTKFHGPVVVNLGEGDDFAVLGHQLNQNNVEMNASARFIGGTGADTIDYRTHGNVFERPPTMLQFEFET